MGNGPEKLQLYVEPGRVEAEARLQDVQEAQEAAGDRDAEVPATMGLPNKQSKKPWRRESTQFKEMQ